MAFQQSEEEFKLPLRQWLTKKIEQKQFDGLEWVDESRQHFKIPWTQKGHPSWEQHYKLFIAWAKHRENYDERNPPDDKKLKGNFRCALNKSDDFEEIKAESKTNQQMGNYKTYKLLTPAEVKAKRENRNRKRSHPPSNSTPAAHNSLDMPEQKKPTEKQHPVMSGATTIFQPCPVLVNPRDVLRESCPKVTRPLKPDIIFSDGIPEYNSFHLEPMIPVEQSGFDEATVPIQGTVQHQAIEDNLAFIDTILVSPGPVLSPEIVDLTPTSPAASDQSLQPQFQSIEDFLNRFNINCDQLSLFRITVYYEKENVSQYVADLSKGVRLMYGDPQKQKSILDAFGKNFNEFNLVPWVLPTYSGSNRHVIKILQSTDLGILLKMDAKNVLRGTRLCQSQVFYFDTSDGNCTSTKMNRQEQIELFSYLKCVRRLIQSQTDRTNEHADTETVLVIGTKPKHPQSSSLVSVVLEPLIAPHLKEHFSVTDRSSLLAISQQNSLDQLVRILDDLDMNSFVT